MAFPISEAELSLLLTEKVGGAMTGPEPTAPSSNRGTQSRPANGSNQKDE